MKKRTITAEELNKILEKHKKWLIDPNDGEGANLSDSDLRDADLRGVVLRYVKLQCAGLRRANLQYADLRCTNLKDADLNFANLNGADLGGANLESADLRGANLQYAHLQNANLSHSKLDDANFKHSIRPWLITANHIGSRFSETLYFADKDNVRCGCWNDYLGGTLAEFKAIVDKTYPADSGNKIHQRYRIEYLSAIKMFESMRNAYLESAAKEKNND